MLKETAPKLPRKRFLCSSIEIEVGSWELRDVCSANYYSRSVAKAATAISSIFLEEASPCWYNFRLLMIFLIKLFVLK